MTTHTTPGTSFELRSPDDIVPPEGLSRRLIDRPIGDVNELYRVYLGPHLTPTYTAAKVRREMGSLAIIDVGCGTARTLKTLGDAVCSLADCDLSSLELRGVNHVDYSLESGDLETVEACQTGRIDYQVGDAFGLEVIPDDTADIVQSYFTIGNIRRPMGWLRSMIRITKPGGYMFFNTSLRQGKPGSPLNQYLGNLQKRGFALGGMYVTCNGPDFQAATAFCRLQKPYVDQPPLPPVIVHPKETAMTDMILNVGLGRRPDGSE